MIEIIILKDKDGKIGSVEKFSKVGKTNAFELKTYGDMTE